MERLSAHVHTANRDAGTYITAVKLSALSTFESRWPCWARLAKVAFSCRISVVRCWRTSKLPRIAQFVACSVSLPRMSNIRKSYTIRQAIISELTPKFISNDIPDYLFPSIVRLPDECLVGDYSSERSRPLFRQDLTHTRWLPSMKRACGNDLRSL